MALGVQRNGCRKQFLPEIVALAPAFERLDDVGRRDRCSIVKFETFAKPESPYLSIVALVVVGDHLRPYMPLHVHAEKGVVDGVAVVSRNDRGGPDGIEYLEIGLRHDTQHLRLRAKAVSRRRGSEHEAASH